MFEFDWKSYYELSLSEAIKHPLYWYALILLISLLLALYLLRKLKKELIEVFTDETGVVQITPNALHELVKKSCDNIPEIHYASTHIAKKGELFRLKVRIRIAKNCKIKETRKSLQKSVEVTMIENLNFAKFQGLDIVIKGFHEVEK